MIVLIQQSNEVSGQSVNHECWLRRCLSEFKPMISCIVSFPFLIFLDQRTPYVANVAEELRRYQHLVSATHKWLQLHVALPSPTADELGQF